MLPRFNTNKVHIMASQAKQVFRQEMALAKSRYAARQWVETIYHLERAHIVGQRYFWCHLITHLWMLRVAYLRQDSRVAVGQLTRILAVPLGYVFGWVPVGNTGRASVSAFAAMPLSADLEELLRED